MPAIGYGRPRGLPNITGTDPGAGTSHAIPADARRFFIWGVGSAGDRIIFRTAPDATVTGVATNGIIGPVGQFLGPFDIDPQTDDFIHVTEGGTGVTAYYISFTRN